VKLASNPASKSHVSGGADVASSSDERCGLQAGGEIAGAGVKRPPELEARQDGLQY
jgi:hypothetical protein